MAQKSGIITNWDGIPVYDIDTGMYLAHFSEEQKYILDKGMWGNHDRDFWLNQNPPRTVPFNDISFAAYPGLSAQKMEIIINLMSSFYFKPGEAMSLKDKDPDIWMFIWKITHAYFDDWQFYICCHTWQDLLLKTDKDIFSLLGDEIINYNGLELLFITEAYIDGIDEVKSMNTQWTREQWSSLIRNVKQASLKRANKKLNSDIRSWAEDIANKVIIKKHKGNVFSKYDSYFYLLEHIEWMNNYYGGKANCSYKDYCDAIYGRDSVTVPLIDGEFDEKGNYK